MQENDRAKILALLQKGVRIPNPEGIEIGDQVDLDRISGEDVILYNGTKIFGAQTLILRGARIGYEAPVTIENCQLGAEVALKGGFFSNAVFLGKSKMGSGAHVRAGTILEEAASGAHTVGLKQTVLFPFVTLGSLINFCDCLMAGGTSRQNHSEVGSSFIHFNYTPNQDKATPSLIGDVPRGVMLNQAPIFLGGQGGIVGPIRMEYGIVTAAGTIYRKDALTPFRLLFQGGGKGGSIAFSPGQYQGVRRILTNNFIYLGNLFALRQWYLHVRSMFIRSDFPQALLDGLVDKIDLAVSERTRQLDRLCDKLQNFTQGVNVKPPDLPGAFCSNWSTAKAFLDDYRLFSGNDRQMDLFLANLQKAISSHGGDYIGTIQSLSAATIGQGVYWLQGIVDQISTEIWSCIETS